MSCIPPKPVYPKIWQLYMITCDLNDFIYIGGTGNINKRWKDHKYFALNNIKDYPIYDMMRSFGVENFRIVPLLVFDTQVELLDFEELITGHLFDLNYSMLNFVCGPTHKGEINYFFGRHDINNKPFKCIKDGKEQIFQTLKQCSDVIGINSNTIYGTLSGRTIKSRHGYKFEYITV